MLILEFSRRVSRQLPLLSVSACFFPPFVILVGHRRPDECFLVDDIPFLNIAVFFWVGDTSSCVDIAGVSLHDTETRVQIELDAAICF